MQDFNPYGEVKMGTTLISIKYNGGVLLSMDSLVSSGSFVTDRASKKVMELSPSPLKFGSIKVIRCGNAAHSQSISRIVFNYLNFYAMELEEGQPLSIETVVTIYKNIVYNNKKSLQCSFIITNGDKIYSISSGGAAVEHDVLATNGSGSTYIDGFLKDKIKENMTYFEARQLALRATSLAIDSDGSSGGNIRMVDVKKNGQATDEIIDHNEVLKIGDLDHYISNYEEQDDDSKYVSSDRFDLQAFLDEMNQFSCVKKNQGQFSQGFNQLCEKNLEKHSLENIGNFGENGNNFWKYINENIYMPLAFEMDKKNSLSEILIDLVLLNDNNSYVSQNDLESNFGLFEQNILDRFNELELSSQKNQNQKEILLKMTNILRMFHLHWNALRSTQQIDRAKMETQNLMKKILQQYQIKEKFLFDIVKIVSKKISLAYQKFMKAHLDYQLLKQKAPIFLANEIKIRYQVVANNIKFQHLNEIQYVQQLSDIVVIVKAFHLAAYQIGYSQQKCLNSYKELIETQIRTLYDQFNTDIENDKIQIKTKLKRFTATLILKMVYINFRIFQAEGILSILNRPSTDLEVGGNQVIMLFNEFKDQMMIIPKKCVKRLLLKNCTYFNINKVMKYLQGKYKLKRSTGGWSIYRYIIGSLKYMLSYSNDLVWGNYTLYKNYYYQNLYSFVQNFKQKFMIQSDEDIIALGDLIFETIKDFQYNNDDQEHTNHGLIDTLDMQVYHLFLSLKAEFNNFYPVKNNMQIMTQFEDRILRFFVLFQKQHLSQVNDNFLKLLNILTKRINEWKIETSKKPNYSVQMSELPLTAVNLQPQVFHVVGQEPQEHKIDEKQMNRGFIQPPNPLIHQEYIQKQEDQNDANIDFNNNQPEEVIKNSIRKEIKENPNKVIDELFNKIVNKNQVHQEENEQYKKKIYLDGQEQNIDEIKFQKDGNFRKHLKNNDKINYLYFKKPNSEIIPSLKEEFDNSFQGGF